LSDAEARYLEVIWDCADCLGPGAELVDVRREIVEDGVKLVARYRLGARDRESAAVGETILAAHAVLRARILFDRIQFGLSDYLASR
jgi:hypothetical protein